MFFKSYSKSRCINNCELFNDKSSFVYWEDRKPTNDEIDVLEFLNNLNSNNIKILHVGVGGSYIAKRLKKFKFIDGIFELCLEANKLGYKIIIITNQSGIGRGYFSENQFQVLTQWLENFFKTKDIIIEKTYFCPHHKDAKIGKYKKECFFRKPNPGMILKAAEDISIL